MRAYMRPTRDARGDDIDFTGDADVRLRSGDARPITRGACRDGAGVIAHGTDPEGARAGREIRSAAQERMIAWMEGWLVSAMASRPGFSARQHRAWRG